MSCWDMVVIVIFIAMHYVCASSDEKSRLRDCADTASCAKLFKAYLPDNNDKQWNWPIFKWG